MRGRRTRRKQPSRTVRVAWVLLWCAAMAAGGPLSAQKKEYLTGLEADKIRDAELPDPRIKLFVEFAADRLKKLQYELAHPPQGNESPAQKRARAERLNGLVRAYVGCLDDAAAIVKISKEKQSDIRGGVKEMLKKGREFLAYFEALAASQPEKGLSRDELDDAIEGTKEALAAAEKAEKEIAPPPVRRKQ